MKTNILTFFIACILYGNVANAQLSISYTATDILCYADTNGVISLTVIGGTSPYSFLWNTGAISQELINLGAGIYSVTITDSLGDTASLSIELTEPDLLEIFVSADQTICSGQSANIVANALGGNPPYAYFWNPGGFSTGTITVSPVNTTEYCVYATDVNGCTSNTKCATVFLYPSIQISATISEDTICHGDSVLVETEISGGNGGPYSIEIGGIVVEPPIFVSPDQSTTYIIDAYDGCGSLTSGYIFSVWVLPSPDFTILADTSAGCIPLSVNFSVADPQPGDSYFWNFGTNQGFPETSTVSNPVVLYQNGGLFDVSLEVTNTLGCKTTRTTEEMINVVANPVTEISANISVGPPFDVTFLFNNPSPYPCTIGFGDNTSDYFTAPPYLHVYTDTGIYDVSFIFDLHYCTDTLAGTLDLNNQSFSFISIHETGTEGSTGLHISPNPARQKTSISFSLKKKLHIELCIFGIDGLRKEIIYDGELSGGNHSFLIETGNLCQGVYICRLKSKSLFASKRIIVVR